jgi:STE24 endopeptidase
MWLHATTAFVVLVFLWETYLALRERRLLRVASLKDVQPEQKRALEMIRKHLPDAPAAESPPSEPEASAKTGKDGPGLTANVKRSAYSDEQFSKSQAYKLEQQSFELASSTFNMALDLAYLLGGVYPLVWNGYAVDLLERFGLSAEDEIPHAFAFSFVLFVFSQIMGVPWSAYSTFVVEARHGFNQTTVATFVTDLIKGWGIGLLLGGVMLAIVIKVVRWGGEHFWIYAWITIAIISVAMVTVVQYVILPLFNKFTPLEKGDLRTRVEALVAEHKFPGSEVFELDGSRRSSHSNAFFLGLFTKQICLYDTLRQQCNTEEILAILGHEIGHWKLGHTWRMMLAQQLQMGLFLYVFSTFVGDAVLYQSFGFDADSASSGVFVGLFLFSIIWTPISHAGGFAMNSLTRYYEYQADLYAAEAMGEVETISVALLKIHVENKSSLWSDRYVGSIVLVCISWLTLIMGLFSASFLAQISAF